ncbi:hypothetical protein TNCV_4315251 [Trichonephila clavipes]|nr:hypothetical protein TNCV_4315251 [Trichonephila clavipes]
MKGVMLNGMQRGNKRKEIHLLNIKNDYNTIYASRFMRLPHEMSKLQPHRSQFSRHRWTKDCRTRSNKSGELEMSAEMTTNRTVKSSTIYTVVSCTSAFMGLQKKKSKGLSSREHGGQTEDLLHLIHFPG